MARGTVWGVVVEEEEEVEDRDWMQELVKGSVSMKEVVPKKHTHTHTCKYSTQAQSLTLRHMHSRETHIQTHSCTGSEAVTARGLTLPDVLFSSTY